MTIKTDSVAATPGSPLSRSPEDKEGPRDSGSGTRTNTSPCMSDSNNSKPEKQVNPAVKYQRQPPTLDTINVAAAKPSYSIESERASSVSSGTAPSVDSSHNSNSKPGMEQSRASPRSINNMNGFQPDANPSAGRSRRSSRRDGSGELLDGEEGSHKSRDPPTQIQFGSHGSMVVPSTIIGPPPRPPSPYNMSPVPVGMIDPHQQYQHEYSHRRAESWSGNFPPIAPPSPHSSFQMSGNGNPMMPFFNEPQSETNPLLGGSQTDSIGRSSGRRKRKSGSGGHRRAHSTGAAYPGMPGNFFGGDMPPPPPPRTKEQFSPRSEFMKLASSFRGTPDSPSQRKMSASYQVSPQGTPRSNKVSFSPMLSSSSPVGASGYGSINVTNNAAMAMPDFPTSKGGVPGTGGGEAVFLAQKHGQGRHRESTRKRHMRQQSAQLFMEEVKGIEQPLMCRDMVFLLLFLFHIVGIAFLGTTYVHDAVTNDGGTSQEVVTGEEVHLYYSNLVYVAGMSGLFAVAFSMLAFGLMAVIARKFVQVALGLAITISFVWGTVGTGLSPKNVVPITGFIALALSVAYAFIVWDRIPFCAANLTTALSGIKANLGTLVVAVCFQVVSLLYAVYFLFVVVGVYDAIQEGKLSLSHSMQIFVYVMMGVSFYWTYHVILNVVQVTTAGVIAAWWYHPSDASVFRSFSKSVFYSLGSICFGSLLVGPVRLIRQLSVLLRPNADSDSALMCLHECMNCIQTCVSSCVDGLANHFNSWAFTYIGIYGYGFMDAGSNATELFRTRGWTMIVTDDLVPNLLLMMSLVVGGATGLFAQLIDSLGGLHISSLGQPGPVSFAVGFVLGLVVTSVLFGIVSSSVNAVLVCFAASPVDFENNHPDLSHEMRAAWREVWPGCMDVVDLRVALANPSPHHSQRGSNSGIPAEFL